MEKKEIPEVFPPGEFIQQELDARNWTQLDLAYIIDVSPSVVNQLVKGKLRITAKRALELGDAFGTSAEVWIGLQNAYDLAKERLSIDNDRKKRKARFYARVVK